MSVQINTHQLPYESGLVNALSFIPTDSANIKRTIAIFTHGFTSHKGSLLNWATRLVNEGIPTIIFDLPGHYLGSFCEVQTLEHFIDNAPKLFVTAKNILLKDVNADDSNYDNLVFGGHSLGAQLSLIGSEKNIFNLQNKNIINLCVGLGLSPEGSTHLFQTPFYKSTLAIRGQLVSKALDPDVVFPWIKESKKALNISNARIHFITGADDLVVTEQGSERLIDIIGKEKNNITFDKPPKLPHHLPEQAASLIKKFFKSEGFI